MDTDIFTAYAGSCLFVTSVDILRCACISSPRLVNQSFSHKYEIFTNYIDGDQTAQISRTYLNYSLAISQQYANICKYAGMQEFKFTSIKVCKPASKCKYESMEVCKYMEVYVRIWKYKSICKYASMQVFKYASMQL